MTLLTSGLSIPIPKATVAIITDTLSLTKSLCAFRLCSYGIPAWYKLHSTSNAVNVQNEENEHKLNALTEDLSVVL